MQLLPRSELINSPYQRCERLSYLSEIDGLICANNCFLNSIELAKQLHPTAYTSICGDSMGSSPQVR